MSIENILKEAKSNNTLVSVYVDSDDWGQYSVGYVDAITDTHVRLRAISKHGEPAGFEIRILSEVFKVESGGRYERKVEQLTNSQGKIFKEISPKKDGADDLILDTLQQSLDESVIVVVWGNDPDDSLVGFVEKLEADTVSIRLINEFGEDDGLSTIEVDEITSLDFNTQSEQIRNFLYHKKK